MMLKIYVIYNLFSKLAYHNTSFPQGHSKTVQIHMRHPVCIAIGKTQNAENKNHNINTEK
jgi:hypothetical protein